MVIATISKSGIDISNIIIIAEVYMGLWSYHPIRASFEGNMQSLVYIVIFP